MEKEICKLHTHCRACGSDKLRRYLYLGKIPLANNLENSKEKAIKAERFPLQVMFCEDCGLSQLSVVIDPEKLYSYYTYRSGVNGGYIKHCQQMAKDLKQYGLNENSLHIDIAGNDGTLLKEFYKEYKHWTINIDPAENLTKDSDVLSISAFWGTKIANHIKDVYGKAKLVTATNVFAHVDNITEFLEACKIVLKPEGILVIECPYMGDHLEKMEWTQVYFEHLSYISIIPIYQLCEKLNLNLMEVKHQDIHGGTVRLIITHKGYLETIDEGVSPSLYTDREYDEKYENLKTYKEWGEKIYDNIDEFTNGILDIKDKCHKIAAFSASAKGNTLLNASYINYEQIDYIVDETPEKIGKFSPGTGIPIVGMDRLLENPPDYLVLLSWNFKDEIIKKVKDIGYLGKFIIPVPNFQIVD
jgi:hypothetical protein